MAGINKVVIVGRLGQKPELKTSTANPLCTFSVATSESWTDKSNGQKQERTEWHRIVVWGKLAENCAKYLDKGRQVYVEGKLQTRSWEADGQKKYTTEIVAGTVQFLGNTDSSGSRPDPAPPSGGGYNPSSYFDSNEEIPF